MYRLGGKRFLDLVFSFILLIILFPILLIVSLAIIINTRGPIFFRQDRLGKNGRVFKIYKFRTMIVNSENTGTGLFTNINDIRITRIGRVLRKTSIDELPQLLNVLVGDMSIIGPRPPVPFHPYNFKDYPVEFKKRFDYRPGITGWAQINGRTNLSWNKRLKYDLYYHENFSFYLDIKIFILTIHRILSTESIYPDDINIGKKHLKKSDHEI